MTYQDRIEPGDFRRAMNRPLCEFGPCTEHPVTTTKIGEFTMTGEVCPYLHRSNDLVIAKHALQGRISNLLRFTRMIPADVARLGKAWLEVKRKGGIQHPDLGD